MCFITYYLINQVLGIRRIAAQDVKSPLRIRCRVVQVTQATKGYGKENNRGIKTKEALPQPK